MRHAIEMNPPLSQATSVMHFADWLHRHAVTRPTKLAIVTPRIRLTYAQYYAAVMASARNLSELGISRGLTVCICVESHALHCVLIAALNRLGTASVSVAMPVERTGAIAAPDGVHVDRFVVEPGVRGLIPDGAVSADLSWLRPRRDKSAHLEFPGFTDPHATMRILTTSGTTGTVKAISHSSAQWEARNFHYIVGALGEARSGHSLSLFGLSTAGGFRMAFETLWSGGTFFLGWPVHTLAQVIAENKIERIFGSPAQYQALLNQANPNAHDLSSLKHVLVGGSTLPRPLIAAIRSTICRRLINYYGSTEMGCVSIHPSTAKDPPGTCGSILPWVEAQSVDTEGSVLPAGVEGILRFRSKDMATGYLNDPQAGAEHFRDGWFYSGDTGLLTEERSLTVTGRVTERINAGGMKSSPDLIEDVVSTYQGVVECAAFGVPDRLGVEQIWTAIVANGEIDFEKLRKHCVQKLGLRTPRQFLQLARIPRNANGKVMRQELVALAAARARA